MRGYREMRDLNKYPRDICKDTQTKVPIDLYKYSSRICRYTPVRIYEATVARGLNKHSLVSAQAGPMKECRTRYLDK